MMGAILQLQKSIYRTHALLSTGSDNLRTLSQIERERFEIRVKVDKGSSDLSINLSDIISKYGNDIIADRKSTRLNSSHTVISYAVFCLIKKRIFFLK